MKNFLNHNKKKAIFLTIFVICFPILILCPTSIGVIPRDIGIAIIGYSGTIIGGFLTLYGVCWTIQDNNINRKKELELQYCPILAASIIGRPTFVSHLSSEIIVLFGRDYFDDTKLNYTNNLIQLRNVGRGEIKKIVVEMNEYNIITVSSPVLRKKLNLSSYVLLDGAFDFIPINGDFYIYVGLPQLKPEYYEQLAENTYIRIELSLYIIVEGMFTSKKQRYILHFFVDITIKDNHEQYNFDSLTFIRI